MPGLTQLWSVPIFITGIKDIKKMKWSPYFTIMRSGTNVGVTQLPQTPILTKHSSDLSFSPNDLKVVSCSFKNVCVWYGNLSNFWFNLFHITDVMYKSHQCNAHVENRIIKFTKSSPFIRFYMNFFVLFIYINYVQIRIEIKIMIFYR